MKFVTINRYFLISFFCSACFCHSLFGSVVGSDTECSRQEAVTFFEFDSNNKMNGFAHFENGFSLETPNTTCTFDSFFPVSGTVDLNVGTLFLQKDLEFDSQTNLVNMGNIYGNGFAIKCSESIQTFTAYSSCAISSWNEVNSLSKTQPIYSVDWTYDDNYVVIGYWQNKIFILSFDGTVLSEVDFSGIDKLPFVVRAHPSAYYFVVGSMSAGPKKELSLHKLVGSTLSSIDSHDLDVEVRGVDWSVNGDYVAIGTNADTRIFSFSSELLNEETSLDLGSGEQVSPGALACDQTGSYYVVGIDHNSNSKVQVYYFDGASISAKDFVDTGADAVTAVDWSRTGSWIAVGTAGAADQLRVYEYDSSSDTFTEKTKISVGGKINSVHWNSDATALLVGKALDNSGTELRIYAFNSSASLLAIDEQAEKTTNINSVRWSHDDAYFVYGDDAYNTTVYEYVIEEDHFPGSVFLDNVVIFLKSDMSWKMATTVRDECIIDGGGKRVTIEEDGEFVVDSGAKLTFRNMELVGVAGSNISLLDDTSQIVFENCDVLFSGDFDFSKGSILFDRDVVLSGAGQFSYSSVMASTVSSYSRLMFDKDFVFYYAPSSDNRDLFVMSDGSSLYLDGCTLKSTATGFRVSSGTIYLDGRLTLSSEGSNVSEAISFGDGSGSVNIKNVPGLDLDVYGEWHYDGV